MNKIEAQQILDVELHNFRDKRYDELQKLMGSHHVIERKGASGDSYKIEIEVLWDSPKKTDLRVVGSIDDGKLLSSLRPLSSDFIMNPDGNFIGE